MSLASRTRDAVRSRPFLHAALRADVLNYSAAAAMLDLDGEADAVATALRRFAADLPDLGTEARDVRVSMESGVGLIDREDPADDTTPLLTVAGAGIVPGAGSLTAVLAVGAVDAAALRHVLGRLAVEEVPVEAAAVGVDRLVAVVPRRNGASAVRLVEDALEAVPSG
jgi:hypothetical protein